MSFERLAPAYKPNAPILPSTRHLIVEGQPAHFFLYMLYAELKASQLLVFPNPMWQSFEAALTYIQHSITPTLRTLMFVTLEPLIYGGSREAFHKLIETSGLACFGILHRLPESVEHVKALNEAAPRLARILVLAEALVETLQQKFQISNVSYLPVHPAFATYATRPPAGIRERIGASGGQVVFTVLGEVRKGKGIDLLLQALDFIGGDDRRDMFFLIAGRSQRLDRETIATALVKKGVGHYLDLRSADNPLKYAVVTEREFGEYLSASDIGLVLYQDEQRTCMSGVAPNYVWGSKPLIAFSDSVIGRTAAQNELGILVEQETPEAVARALTNGVRLLRQGWTPSPAYYAYRAEIAPDAVLSRLAAILGDTETSEEPPRRSPNKLTA